MAKGGSQMVNRRRARHHTVNGQTAVSISGGQTPTIPKSIHLPSIPLAAVLSFLKETRGALTWSTQEMVDSLKISEREANQIIGILSLQGYVKPALDNQGWLTTPAGEEVSGSRLPRFKLDKVNEALSLLEKRIKSVNQDAQGRFKVSEAVAYGDFLLGRPNVQAADVGIRLIGAKPGERNPSETLAFLKLLRGKTALIKVQPYETWMGERSHRRLA
jgi:hypothetical protein